MDESRPRIRHRIMKLQKLRGKERFEREKNIGHMENIKIQMSGFPGGAVVENLPANAGNTGSSPGLGRSHMPRSN